MERNLTNVMTVARLLVKNQTLHAIREYILERSNANAMSVAKLLV